MAIYDFSKMEKNALSASVVPHVQHVEAIPSDVQETQVIQPETSKRDQIFSAVAARLFFLLLLIGDVLWIGFAMAKLCVSLVGAACTGGKVPFFKALSEKAWISARRSFVCGVCLLMALFSPSFGIMIACTYFLMYDKSGIEEVVPSALQSQFKEFFPKE